MALQVAQLYPDPNVAGTDLFAYNPVRDVRADHQLNQATPIFGRVSYSKLKLLKPGDASQPCDRRHQRCSHGPQAKPKV